MWVLTTIFKQNRISKSYKVYIFTFVIFIHFTYKNDVKYFHYHHNDVTKATKNRLSASRARPPRLPHLFQDCRSTGSTTYKSLPTEVCPYALIYFESNYKY